MKGENKRGYLRANTLLPFEARRLGVKEYDNLQCRVSMGSIVIDEPPPPVEDEKMNAWLNMLNAKLDYLIRFAPLQHEISSSMTFEPVNISGSGMMMMTADELQVGNILEIMMVLQAYPAKILYLYGEVIRLEKTPKRPDIHTVGIKFLGMNEEVRDEILKFEFKKHGERLLMRKGRGGSGLGS